MVLGTGARRIIAQMSLEQAARVQAANLAWLDENGVDSVETNVNDAVATRGWRRGPGTRDPGHERLEREGPQRLRSRLGKEESP